MTTIREVFQEQLGKFDFRKTADAFSSFRSEMQHALNDLANQYLVLYSFRESPSLVEHMKKRIADTKKHYPQPIPKDGTILKRMSLRPEELQYIEKYFAFIDIVNRYLEAGQFTEDELSELKQILDTYCYGQPL